MADSDSSIDEFVEDFFVPGNLLAYTIGRVDYCLIVQNVRNAGVIGETHSYVIDCAYLSRDHLKILVGVNDNNSPEIFVYDPGTHFDIKGKGVLSGKRIMGKAYESPRNGEGIFTIGMLPKVNVLEFTIQEYEGEPP